MKPIFHYFFSYKIDNVLKTELHVFVQATEFLWVLRAALSQHGVSQRLIHTA